MRDSLQMFAGLGAKYGKSDVNDVLFVVTVINVVCKLVTYVK